MTSEEMCLSHVKYMTKWGMEELALAPFNKPLPGKVKRGRDISGKKSTENMDAVQYLGVSGTYLQVAQCHRV